MKAVNSRLKLLVAEKEMRERRSDFYVRALRARVRGGEALVLLCSSACTDAERCHRSLLRRLIVD